jgi:hypothetical protein
MVAERQARYPRGSYKVLIARRDGNMEYSIVNLYTGRQSRLLSVWDMIKSIESDLTANKFPQSAIQYRSWGSQAESRPEKGKVVNIDSAKAGQLPEDSNPTFVIQVLYRQNATWQGSIQWIEGRQTRQYRSVNELLKLLDEALNLTLAGHVGDTK